MPYDKAPSEVFAEEIRQLMTSREDEEHVVASMAIDAGYYGLSTNPEQLMVEVNELRGGGPSTWDILVAAYEGKPGQELILRLADQYFLNTD